MLLQKLTAPLPTGREMHYWDKEAMAHGIAECILMENAAREAFTVLQELQGNLQHKYVLLFMGNGNNGGDAVCLARHALDVGAHPLILHTKPLRSYTGVTKQHLKAAQKCGVPLLYIGQGAWQKKLPEAWKMPHIVVDGLLGTGFEGALRPQFKEYISYINACREHSYIFSLDIPSGCDALTGLPPQYEHTEALAVHAHATVCFAAAKPGLVLPHSAPYTGKLFVRAIGIPRVVQEKNAPSFRLLQERSLAHILTTQQHAQNTHKGRWGHVLVMGGSQSFTIQGSGTDLTGAAHLTALAAARTGAGLVTAVAPTALCASVKNACPHIMTLGVSHENTPAQWPNTLPVALENKLTSVQALALGPGMGTDTQAQNFLLAVLAHDSRPRAVLDADALTLLARHPELRAFLGEEDILTPHPGEAARFLGCTAQDIQKDRVYALQQLSAILPCVCLLKGAGTLITQRQQPIYILPKDIPALALAGSGDVLTGCTAALSARFPHMPSITVTALAACIHAGTGILAQKAFPQRGHMATDLAHLLPQAMQELCTLEQNHCALSPSYSHEVYSLDHQL